jgi:hypothetical protein
MVKGLGWRIWWQRYEWARRREKLLTWFVWRLPRRVVYWSAIRVAVHATQGQWGSQEVPSLTIMEMLERWDVPHEQSPGGQVTVGVDVARPGSAVVRHDDGRFEIVEASA